MEAHGHGRGAFREGAGRCKTGWVHQHIPTVAKRRKAGGIWTETGQVAHAYLGM